MTRNGRGVTRLDANQQAKLEVVRNRRIDRDNGLEELEIQIQSLRDTFMQERDAALRSAVWAAEDAQIPKAHIKRILNITDHRTYQRWLEGYVEKVVTGFEYAPTDNGSILLTRFKHFTLNMVFALAGANGEDLRLVSGADELDAPALSDSLSSDPALYDEWEELTNEIEKELRNV